MSDQIGDFKAESFDYSIVVPPTVSPMQLRVAKRVMIPCPDNVQRECDSADLLTESDAGWVEEYLDGVSESERTASEEINLGCALAWLDDWNGASEAFVRAGKKASDDELKKLASANEQLAAKALT